MDAMTIAVLVALAGVFVASGTAKLRSRTAYADYRAALGATTLIGADVLSLVAAGLAASEVVVALAALGATVALLAGLPAATLSAALACAGALALSAVLTGGVVIAVRRAIRTPCACFGAGSARPLGRFHVIRNAALCALCGFGVVAASMAPAATPAADLLAVVPGAILAVLFARAEDVVTLFLPLPVGVPERSR